MNARRILIVDDEPQFTRMVGQHLEQAGGFEVREENHSANALSVARQFNPDLVLLDVLMPGMDGGELAERMRADATLAHTPIVFLTATITPEEARERGRDSGFLFLSKPVQFAELVECINQHARRAQPGASR
jgi:DNA-binding response OmpR family regulator